MYVCMYECVCIFIYIIYLLFILLFILYKPMTHRPTKVQINFLSDFCHIFL